jgi:hypothetical protein
VSVFFLWNMYAVFLFQFFRLFLILDKLLTCVSYSHYFMFGGVTWFIMYYMVCSSWFSVYRVFKGLLILMSKKLMQLLCSFVG